MGAESEERPEEPHPLIPAYEPPLPTEIVITFDLKDAWVNPDLEEILRKSAIDNAVANKN